jgi:hypothetical protein
MTPIGLRLFDSLNDEYLRMLNEWFFKWHSTRRSHGVEIDSFLGKPIFYGGLKFDGSARLVYWDTIRRYLRKKIGTIFDSLEEELDKYPPKIRAEALTEARWVVSQFAAKIRRAAIEKDRILRGNGIEFPPEHDAGHWEGCGTGDIEGRVEGLRQIYCDLEQDVPTATTKLSDAVILRPTFIGMGIDLQKAWSWVHDKWRGARGRRCGMKP